MIDFKAWKGRLWNELEVQKYNQRQIVNMSFTREELIELKMMIEVLEEQLKSQKM